MNATLSTVSPFPARLSRLIAPLPPALIEPAANLLLRRLLAAHPGLFERLGDYGNRQFSFAPTDLDLAFVLRPANGKIRIFRKSAPFAADASIEGPLFLLLALLEGRLDADALFFSRDLAVTGDMEAMLAMRNALDDAGLDLTRDLATLAGPLASPASRLMAAIRARVLHERKQEWN